MDLRRPHTARRSRREVTTPPTLLLTPLTLLLTLLTPLTPLTLLRRSPPLDNSLPNGRPLARRVITSGSLERGVRDHIGAVDGHRLLLPATGPHEPSEEKWHA